MVNVFVKIDERCKMSLVHGLVIRGRPEID